MFDSETQLRSRLKKWRVTKPSRQSRKKSLASASGEDQDSDKDVKPKPSTVQRPLPSLPPSLPRESRPEWPMTHPMYGQPPALQPVPDQDQDRKWGSPMTQQLTPSPSGEHVLAVDRTTAISYPDPSPTTASFDHGHASPITEGLMLNTTAVAPSYQAYPLSPESCLPSPGAPTTTPGSMGWPTRAVSVDYGLTPNQWYSMPFEAITPPAAVPQSTTAPMAPMHGYLPGQGQIYHPQYALYHGEAQEYHGFNDAKNWKRASAQYDMAGHLAGHEHGDGKQMPRPMVAPSHTQSGPQSVMCAPMPYVGHDQYAQKPPNIGY